MIETSFPKEKIKVLLLENIHPIAKENFEKAGYTNVELLKTALPKEELIEKIKDVHLIGIRSKTKLTEEVLQHAKKLWAVGCFCIGTNQVDLLKATKDGIAVFNSPYSNTRSVAELVIAESIMLYRGIIDKNRAAHAGEWLKTAKGSHELRGKTLGIVGYGHIGSQVSVLAEALGLKVIYYDVEPKLPLGNAVSKDSIDELLAESDILTLHVPADSETHEMIDAAAIAKMKPGSMLINLSRGTVVVIDDLVAALDSGHIAGAAVDVYPSEPKSNADPFDTPLRNKPNVILTPHIGGSTQEAQYNIGLDASTKLINYMDKGSTVGSHSVPALNLPTQQNKTTHRILHIHHNQPGIMAAINSNISKNNLNILGQYLKTNEHIGYVVLDVEEDDSNTLALKDLKQVPHTINARILF